MSKKNIDKALTKTKNKNSNEKKECKIKKLFKNILEVLKKKWLVNTSTTLLLVAIILGIYYAGTTILEKVTIPDIDCTTEKIYSISEETKNRIKDIDKDIKITLINYKDVDTMHNIIDQYKATNKKITVEEIDDLTNRLDLVQEYNIQEGSSLILVSSENQEIEITEDQLYSYDYTTYQQIDVTEEVVTNAIVNVTTEDKPKIFFMNNHNLYSLEAYEGIIDALQGDANEVEEINLLNKGGVPEECDTLVITTLKEDINELEKKYIMDYINNGGNLLLLCGPNVTGTKFKNFYEILAVYGITYEEGVVVEGDESKMFSNYPYFVIEDFYSSSITNGKSLNLKAYFTAAGAVTLTDNASEVGVEYERLLETSYDAFIRKNLNIQNGRRTDADSEEGQYLLGVLAKKKLDEEKTSKLIIYTDEVFDIITIDYISFLAGNNQDIVANSIAYLNKKENTITIRKNFDQVTFTTTEQQDRIITDIIVITPFVVILIGICVWITRKRKK